jgi:Transposase IS66 family/IS66 C-terminal element
MTAPRPKSSRIRMRGKIGRWFVVADAGERDGARRWQCLCTRHATERIVAEPDLLNREANAPQQPCRCEEPSGDLTDRVYGLWTVLEAAASGGEQAGDPPGRSWRCRCACGGERVTEQAKEQELSRAEYEALRLRLRQEKSVPLLTSFGAWLEKQAAAVLPKSPLAEAVGYARNQWAALQVYTTAGFLGIDNNTAERALRAVAIGRKNYLFFGSDVGGKTAAVLYTFTQTCQAQGIEPWRYLRDVLARLPRHPPEQLAELLPDAWARAQRCASEAPSPG